MELKDTIKMMDNAEYKERFKAEYYQLKIRLEKLHNMLIKYKVATDNIPLVSTEFERKEVFNKYLGFQPSCSYKLLKEQEEAMNRYILCLEERAIIEEIEL